MLKSLILLLTLPLGAPAQAIIYTPGEAPVIIQQDASGYTVNDINKGPTHVLDLGGFKMIQPYGGPSTYIIGDTPGVTPVIPLEPDEPALGLPTGPNNEYKM